MSVIINNSSSGGSGSGVTFTDGTHTVSDATQLTVTGATIGGAGVDATLTVTGGSSGANPSATAGPTAIDGSATTFMRSDAAPAIQLASASQFGIVEVDGTTITATDGVISAVSSGGPSAANPTATAGPSAVDGSATTFMRSDAAPAIQKASSGQFGIAKVDGTTITASGGVISAVDAGIKFTDGTHTVSGATQLTVSGGTIGGSGADATLTITGGSGSGVTFTDGTHTVSDATQLTVSGATISGSGVDAVLTVSGSGNNTYVSTVSTLNGASYSSYSALILGGYTSANDGGGGLLVASTGTADNVMLFADSGGNIFERYDRSFLSVKQAGAVGDGTTDDTTAFTRFDTAGGGWVMPESASATTFYLNGTWSPTHRVIIGPNVILKFGPSAVITFEDLVIISDYSQCFEYSTASVTIKSVAHLTPNHFGAAGDGTTDDTTAVQQCVSATPAYGTIVFPTGCSYAISSTTTPPQSAAGVTYLGYGSKIVKASGAGNVWTFNPNTNNRFIGMTFSFGENATYWGNEVAGSSAIRAVITNQVSGVEVANCYFENILIAVWCDGAQNWNIHDNRGINFYHAVFGECNPSQPFAQLHIAGNIWSESQDAMIALASSSPPNTSLSATYIQIVDNILSNANIGAPSGALHANDGFSIDLESSLFASDCLIAGNIVNQSAYSGTTAYRGGISISGASIGEGNIRCSVRDNICIGDPSTSSAGGYSCIHAQFAAESVISNNYCYNYAGNGISLIGSLDCVVQDNQIINCGSSSECAIYVAQAGNTTTNAKVIGNRVAILSGYANATSALGIVVSNSGSGSSRTSGIVINDNYIENIQNIAIDVEGTTTDEECLVQQISNNIITGGGSDANGIKISWVLGAQITGNKVYDVGTGLLGSNNSYIQCSDNQFYDDSSVSSYFVSITGTNTDSFMRNNGFFETGSATGYVAASGFTLQGNYGSGGSGYLTENRGTATVLSSSNYVTVAHGLASTPTTFNIAAEGDITPATHWYVNGITSANFNIVTNVNPTSSTVFSWEAKV